MNVIPVVFATDNGFVSYCGVAIYSLICNANPNNKYEIYILHDNLSSNSIERLEQLTNDYAQVKCVNIHDKIENLCVTEYGHLSIASAYRVIIADILPNYNKVLYIDSDVIVCDDVAELYNIDIEDNILGATEAIVACNDFYYRNILNINRTEYFNAGILVINTEAFTSYAIKDKCFELLGSRTDFQFMDQDALNISCQGKVQFIDKRWNYEWMYLFGDYDDVEIIDNPSIIHYDSIEKPWTNPEAKYADVFWKYARETVFYEEILQKTHLSITGEVLRNLGAEAIGKNIAVYGAGYVGSRFVRNLKQIGICNITIWVDRDYKDKSCEIMRVSSVDTIYDAEFDYIIIAIKNNEISRKVREMLISHGIEECKIKLIK